MRRTALLLALLAGCGGDAITLRDLEGVAVRLDAPLAVFVFVQPGCPIADQRAPEILRLRDAFPAATFWAVYPGRRFSTDELRAHRAAYLPGLPALLDPDFALARACRVSVTPEAAVRTSKDGLVYRGRIDDLYADLGVRRPAPTRRDLEDALAALSRGEKPPRAEAPAVGCRLPE